MDLGTIGGKYLKKTGVLKNLDESEEINACTVQHRPWTTNGKDEPWLLLFKNETHNHPTEIEPFGGAATCIGGAIRDPLSGRGYVYQAMRVTGAGDPLVPVQRHHARQAAPAQAGDHRRGGLFQLRQPDRPGHRSWWTSCTTRATSPSAWRSARWWARRPSANVRREQPVPGDVVILLGGRTGRDGCGGATGSSKAHKLESLETCGAEVQKGNAPDGAQAAAPVPQPRRPRG